MKVEQISVFLENKSGRLAEVARALAEAGVNIRALSVADTSDFGILRLIVNNNEKAVSALKQHGFTVSKTEVLALEVPDVPGGLSKILELLDREKINVEYVYAFVERRSDNALIIIRVGEIDRARTILADNNVPIVAGDRIYGM